MTTNESEKEFARGKQITLQMTLTPEQAAAMREWSSSIPTLYLLDICVVNATKLSESALAVDTRKAQLVARLRNLDRPQNSFSYLLALIEKVSDVRSGLSDEELEAQILEDVGSMRRFFANARVQEPDNFLLDFLKTLRRQPHELMHDSYLAFLTAANDRFKLASPVSRTKRMKVAEAILAQADALSISRQHPLVLLTLACLYGNASARKVMKFKADAQAFRAENALADIMVISRFLPLKLQIEQSGRDGNAGYLRSTYITDDSGLDGVLACFEAEVVRFEEQDGVHEQRTSVTVHFAQLLTEIGKDVSELRKTDHPNALARSEYDQLCDLLFTTSPNAP